MVTHLPSQKGDRAPQLSAHVHCAQTAGWIKMSLGRKVGLDPSNIALDGDSAPLPKKGAEFPQFWPMSLLCQNGWTDQHATWYGGRPRRKPHCARWGPSSYKQGGTAPNFRPMSIVAKRLDWSRCHLVRRQASAQAALCYMGTQLPLPKGAQPPVFGPCLLWPNAIAEHLFLFQIKSQSI